MWAEILSPLRETEALGRATTLSGIAMTLSMGRKSWAATRIAGAVMTPLAEIDGMKHLIATIPLLIGMALAGRNWLAVGRPASPGGAALAGQPDEAPNCTLGGREHSRQLSAPKIPTPE